MVGHGRNISERMNHPVIVMVYVVVFACLVFFATGWLIIILAANLTINVIWRPLKLHQVKIAMIYLTVLAVAFGTLGLVLGNCSPLDLLKSFARFGLLIVLGLWLVEVISPSEVYLFFHKHRLTTLGLSLMVGILSLPNLKKRAQTVWLVQKQSSKLARRPLRARIIDVIRVFTCSLIERAEQIDKAVTIRNLIAPPEGIREPEWWRFTTFGNMLLITLTCLLPLSFAVQLFLEAVR